MELHLTAVEVRILGCLIEKEAATPDHYPLTLNSLVTACNQKSNRSPVMSLDEKSVMKALEDLRYEHHMVCRLSAAGSRVPKYSHTLQELWNFSSEELAVLSELFVRGPQTVGELRTHASRLCPLADTGVVLDVLEALTSRESGALVVQLPREAGRREQRWAHLFCGEVDVSSDDYEAPPEPALVAVQADEERIKHLEEDVAELRETVEQLQSELAAFRQQFE